MQIIRPVSFYSKKHINSEHYVQFIPIYFFRELSKEKYTVTSCRRVPLTTQQISVAILVEIFVKGLIIRGM
jgi:hypothetical protein